MWLIGSSAIFAGPHKEVEGQANHVYHGLSEGCAGRGIVCVCGPLNEEGDREWLGPGRRGVFFLECFVHSRNAEI